MRKLINAPDKCLLDKELDCDYDKIFIDGDLCDETTCPRLREYLEVSQERKDSRMNNKTKLKMLQELEDWMIKYNVRISYVLPEMMSIEQKDSNDYVEVKGFWDIISVDGIENGISEIRRNK